jgi:hypothetical protein
MTVLTFGLVVLVALTLLLFGPTLLEISRHRTARPDPMRDGRNRLR